MNKVMINSEAIKIRNEAEKYYSFVNNGIHNKSKFSDTLLFNTMMISFERFLYAFLINKNLIPKSHSLSGLLIETSEYIDWSEIEDNDMQLLKRTANMCSGSMAIIDRKDMITLFEILGLIRKETMN